MTVVEVLESAAKSTLKKLTQHCRILLCLLGLLCFALAALMRACECVYTCVRGCACARLSVCACVCIYNACNLSARKTATKSKHFTVLSVLRPSVLFVCLHSHSFFLYLTLYRPFFSCFRRHFLFSLMSLIAICPRDRI